MRDGEEATAASIEFLVTSLIVAATPGTGVLYTLTAGLRTRFDLRTDFGIGRLSIVLISLAAAMRGSLAAAMRGAQVPLPGALLHRRLAWA